MPFPSLFTTHLHPQKTPPLLSPLRQSSPEADLELITLAQVAYKVLLEEIGKGVGEAGQARGQNQLYVRCCAQLCKGSFGLTPWNPRQERRGFHTPVLNKHWQLAKDRPAAGRGL